MINKNFKIAAVAATCLLAFAFTIETLISWKLKDKYSVKISGGHLQGSFDGLKAAILFDEVHPERSKIIASIDATTVKVGSDEGNAHAKEALATDKFPLINFISTAIAKSKTGMGYEATGNLTLKGVTKEIKFPFYFDSQKMASDKFPFVFKETFGGRITIVPKDFNVVRDGMPALLYIDLEIPVTK